MRKLNVVFIQGDKKDDAILKIKDDSLTITTSDGNLVKIPYSNIKDYSKIEKAHNRPHRQSNHCDENSQVLHNCSVF